MKTHFFLTGFAALALSQAACGSTESGSRDDEVVDEGALSTTARNLVGPYFANDGSDKYATELHLESDGTFKAKLNRPMVGGGMCVAAPCVADAEGRFSARSDRLTLRVQKLDGRSGTKTLNFKYRLERGIVPMLTLDGTTFPRGEQRFTGRGAEAGHSCAVLRCGPGTRCIERSDGLGSCVPTSNPGPGCAAMDCSPGMLCIERSDGQGTCVSEESASCANKQCGDQCTICMGQPGCVESEQIKLCGADGECRGTVPVCN